MEGYPLARIDPSAESSRINVQMGTVENFPFMRTPTAYIINTGHITYTVAAHIYDIAEFDDIRVIINRHINTVTPELVEKDEHEKHFYYILVQGESTTFSGQGFVSKNALSIKREKKPTWVAEGLPDGTMSYASTIMLEGVKYTFSFRYGDGNEHSQLVKDFMRDFSYQQLYCLRPENQENRNERGSDYTKSYPSTDGSWTAPAPNWVFEELLFFAQDKYHVVGFFSITIQMEIQHVPFGGIYGPFRRSM